MATKTVCDNQDIFNKSFRNSIKYVENKNKPNKTMMTLALVIYVIFVVWALILSTKTPDNKRTEHILYSLLFSPAYIISYYLGN
jgi:hypothetical protein